jgi:hypothetical protein
MPAINFSMFIDKLQDNASTCIIRRDVPRGLKAGGICKLYTGAKDKSSKDCRFLVDVEITHIFNLTIYRNGYLRVNQNEISVNHYADIIKENGFDSIKSFIGYHFRNNPHRDILSRKLIYFEIK